MIHNVATYELKREEKNTILTRNINAALPVTERFEG